jgi:hypothetical protein
VDRAAGSHGRADRPGEALARVCNFPGASAYPPLENLPGAPAAEGWVSRWLLVVLRLHLGVILLLTVTGKLTGDGPFSEQLLGFVRRGAGRGDPTAGSSGKS